MSNVFQRDDVDDNLDIQYDVDFALDPEVIIRKKEI